MITLKTNEIDIHDIPGYVFPAQLACVVFARLEYDSWHLKFSMGSKVLIEEDYVADQNGDVRVYGLDDVIRASSTVGMMEEYTLEMYDKGEVGKGFTAELVAVPCNLHPGIDARTYLENFFLTPIQSKTTELGRQEQLSYIRLSPLPETADILVTAEYWGDGAKQTKSYNLGSVGRQSVAPGTVDVSPDQFLVDGWQLVRYTVTLDERSFVYTLGTAEEPGFGFVFRNSFGCLDTFYCMGDLETDPQFDRLNGRFSGRTLVYNAQETYERIAHSGQIPLDMVALWDDLVRSIEIYTVDDGREVMITESDSGRTDDLTGYPSGTITFRPSGRYAPLAISITQRIFDDSFDDTFN